MPPSNYKRYTKAKTAEKYLREQMDLARRDLAYLESILQEIQQAETEQDFLDIRGEMSDAGFIRKQGKKVLQRPPSHGNSKPPAASGCWWGGTTAKMIS